MANHPVVLDLLTRLSAIPVRRGSVLDVPFGEYLEDVRSPEVARILATYARAHVRPTLRKVLVDPRFRRWVEVSGRSPVRTMVEAELATITGIVEEEDMLDTEPLEPVPSAGRSPARPADATLVVWAEEVGVAARLRDPAGALMPRVEDGDLRRALRSARRATVADVLARTFDSGRYRLTSGERATLATHAGAYVSDAGERELADRREAARIAALGHVPAGKGAQDFMAALDVALARIGSSSGSATDASARTMTFVAISFEQTPVRIALKAALPPNRDGRRRTIAIDLVLADWQVSPLHTSIRSVAKEGRSAEAAELVLGHARRVLGDPRHALHAKVVAYLNEPPWTRVLAKLDTVVARNVPARAETSIAWQVTTDRGVQIMPLVRERNGAGSDAVQVSSIDAIVDGRITGATARDEEVARALWVGPQPYGYYSAPSPRAQGEDRERKFRALSLLAGKGNVYGRDGAALRVIEGPLGVTLEASEGEGASEREASGYRFVFDVAGEHIGAAELRADLDAAGYLVHVDPTRGRVLLAYLGSRDVGVVAALASEAATFPASAGAALVEHVIGLADAVSIVLPPALAGEAIEADARPVVRVVRPDVDSLSLTWLVRPIAGGSTFAPGEGPSQILQQVGGRAAFAPRSFEDERRRRDAVRGLLPEAIAGDARFEGMETVLAVVAALRGAAESGDASVEWPKSLPRVIGDASWSKLRLRLTEQRDWFGLNGTAEIDGVEITLSDLLAARRNGDRFVVVGPDKLVAIEDELRSRLEDLDALARPSKTGLTLVSAAVPALADLLASKKQLDAVPAFWSLLARIEAAAASDPRVPRGFSKILRPYQVDGFRWMSRLAAWGAGACLADEMGLGKTVQTLALLVARSKDGPALVVAPTSVGPNWIIEAKRFAPSLNPILHRGSGRTATLAKLRPGDLLVTSYELAARDADELSKITFSTLVLDEAQAIKNGGTTRARAARSLRADFRLALTGTPVENRLSELFSLMEFLNPGFFGSETEFRARYIVPIERDRAPERSAALARLVRPFMLRRKKADVLAELPARTEITRAVERTPAERKLYEAARQLALAALAGPAGTELTKVDEGARFQILAEIMRLRRLACHPRLDDARSKVPSSKLDAFLELVTELREGGHRALVFSQFTGHLALVEEALRAREIPYLYLDGKTSVPERTRRVAAFQSGEGALFLISLKAGGTGLNLTAADTVIHLDPWWNPAVEDQATDRAHRIGQTRPVTVIRLIAQGTIEEAVMALHTDKRQLAESILDGSAASGKLSIAELGALIREGAAT